MKVGNGIIHHIEKNEWWFTYEIPDSTHPAEYCEHDLPKQTCPKCAPDQKSVYEREKNKRRSPFRFREEKK